MEHQEHLSLALVQFNIEWESANNNIEKIEQLISDLHGEVDLIILPEAFNTGFSISSKDMAEQPDGKTVEWMKDFSIRKDCAVCGSLFVIDGGCYYNRFYWIEPNGKLLFYDKRHLFSLGDEDKLFTSGKNQLIIDYKGWRIFPQICYDLRFPVWSRNIHSYDLLINVANWPASRNEVWKTLLKARAIENQCYVAAVNRVGVDGNDVEYIGNSLVVDAKGIKILKAHHRETVEAISLDYHSLRKFRKKFNTLKDGDDFILSI
jgi:omega-amidase